MQYSLGIKHGFGGINEKITFPIKLNYNVKNFNSIRGALTDYINLKNIERGLIKTIPNYIIKQKNYLVFITNISEEYIENLRKRGLKPALKETKNFIRISYRIPGTNIRKTSKVPKKLVFNEKFSKQFGKWSGDKCGGLRKIGVANKNWIFVKEFHDFIKNEFKQDDVKLYLTCKNGFKPNYKIIKNLDIFYSKTQHGDYAYRTEVSNAIFKNIIFDKFEKNLFRILYNSKKSVRYAFYAGLFEAEGSISKDSKIMSFSFGLNLMKNKSIENISKLYKKSVEINYLLNKDGFISRISRKIANTNKSKTLKYDISLLNSDDSKERS